MRPDCAHAEGVEQLLVGGMTNIAAVGGARDRRASGGAEQVHPLVDFVVGEQYRALTLGLLFRDFMGSHQRLNLRLNRHQTISAISRRTDAGTLAVAAGRFVSGFNRHGYTVLAVLPNRARALPTEKQGLAVGREFQHD